ncbi:MAG: DUF5647 family protein [Candidatus Binatia bacterium]
MIWFEERNAELVAEFDRYVMEHPAFAARIPRGAQVVLQLSGDPKFNAWLRRLARKQRQPGQPVVVVDIRKLLPARSRIRALRLRIDAA